MVRDSTEAVFFYCSPAGPPEKSAYQHTLVCLGEGLKELRTPFYSNIDYWRISANDDEHLFGSDPAVTPHDCSVVVVTDDWFTHGNPFPQTLFEPHPEYVTVYLDCADGHRTLACSPEFRQFDIILRTHYSSRCRYPSNVHPWAFGLTNRILQESDGLTAFHDRRRSLLVNYRVSHPVREVVRQQFLPRIQNILPLDDSINSFDEPPTERYHRLQWTQTGRRHYPYYYRRLKESAACACFGGVFVPPWPRDTFAPLTFWDRNLNRLWRVWQRTLKRLVSHPKRIGQWDSYRFWESLASGCVAFHVDLEKYGCLLPVMPENWQHYVGIDLDNPQEAVDRISEDRDTLERISVQGRRWALENYGPVPVAERFLEMVGRGLR